MFRRAADRRGEAGFTLIEILVTLAITAVLAGAVAMSLGDGRTREADQAVRRLAARLQYALDDALIGDRHVALIGDPKTGYRFIAQNPLDRNWTDAGADLANDGTDWPKLRIEGLGAATVIRFRPGGESDPFDLILASDERVWRITGDGLSVTLADQNGD